MLNDLKFVAGAVAKKDFVAALQYFKIEGGHIYAYNGSMAISTPTDLDVTVMPKAAPLIKAIEKVPEDTEIALNLTAAGRLSVKAGNFRCYVECHADEQAFPQLGPDGDYYPLAGAFLPVLRKLTPFMGIDASRPWAMGILFDGPSAYATNNIILVQQWLGAQPLPRFCMPAEAVKQLVRIGKEPTGMHLSERAVTFHYENGAWLRTALHSTEWPDLEKVLNRDAEPKAFPDGFFEGVSRLSHFTEKSNRLYLNGGVLSTSAHEGDGAAVDLADFGGKGIFYLSEVEKLAGVAEMIDWNMYPEFPCLFYGDMLRGALVGLRG